MEPQYRGLLVFLQSVFREQKDSLEGHVGNHDQTVIDSISTFVDDIQQALDITDQDVQERGEVDPLTIRVNTNQISILYNYESQITEYAVMVSNIRIYGNGNAMCNLNLFDYDGNSAFEYIYGIQAAEIPSYIVSIVQALQNVDPVGCAAEGLAELTM